MKKNRLLVVIACLLLIFVLVGCADALADQRTEAISQAEALLQGEDYAGLDESIVQGVIDTAVSSIGSAETAEDIQKAVSDAIATLDKLVLDGVKSSAKQEVEAYVDLSKVSAEVKALIEAKISEAKTAIDECVSKADVDAKFNAVKGEIDVIVARGGVETALNAYDLSKYSEANKAIIEGKIASAKDAVASLSSVAEINAKLQEVKAEIDAIPTILKDAQNNAIVELEGYIKDKDNYSEKGLAEIDRIIADAKENINKASDTESISEMVEDTKSDLDKVLTIQGEKEASVLELKNSMASLIGNVVEDYTTVEGTNIIIDTVTDIQSTCLYFGNQDGNTATVFDTYLTVNYKNTEWSSVTIRFRAWDQLTCYTFDLRDGYVEFHKDAYKEGAPNNRDRTTIIIGSNGIKQNETVHLQIISWGWTKKVLINDECVFSIVENAYNTGRIYIETWEAGVVLSDPTYIEYATDAELKAVWGEELAKECINKTEQEKLDEAKAFAKSEVASYIENVNIYSEANQAVISGIIEACNSAIDECDSIEKVNAAVVAVKAQLDAVYTIEEEEALATAIANAKNEISSHLSDVENAYSEEKQAQIASIIATANSTIEACKSIDEVNAAVVQIKKQLNAVPTIEQEANAEFLAKKEEAKTSIASYLSDVASNYSEANQAVIAKIISDGNDTIDGCGNDAALENAVEDIKKALAAVSTIAQETLAAQTAKAEAFLSSLSDVSGKNSILGDASVVDGKLVFDTKKSGYGGDVKFGSQDGNMNKAFDAYVTVNYNSTYWNSATIRFCAWDTNSCLQMVVRDDGVKIYKVQWNNDTGKADEILLAESDKGFKDGQEVHLQIVTKGWTKMVVVDGVCIFKCWPNAFHVGYTMFGVWECGITIRDPIYTEYGSEDEVQAAYADVLALSSYNEEELNGKF